MSQSYKSADIEVLTGLEPVRRRPGMYTDTTRPNHLVQEVVDNSVDEALAGHANHIEVSLHPDGSIEVSDNGRGMPVDKHPEHKLPGVELILGKLHAGGKFSNKNYQFSGGLHGVGVSVVNALSEHLEVFIKRGGSEYHIQFANGEKISDLKAIDKVGQRNTGTRILFRPNGKYFDSPRVSLKQLQHNLKAKAVLCPGLTVVLNAPDIEPIRWHFEDGLTDYLKAGIAGLETLPDTPITGSHQTEIEQLDWALNWLPEGELVQESYVNLIPTAQHGTHVNGLRSGLIEAMREFCDIQSLLPRGVRLAPEDIWERLAFILSVKMSDPQFSGQTKERLTSRSIATFVANIVKDTFSLWLNQNVELGKIIAELAISNAQKRLKASKQVKRKKIASGPALPGKLADCASQDLNQTELFIVEGDSAGGSAKQARNREYQAILPIRGKILNTWEVESGAVLNSNEVHDLAVAIGMDAGDDNLEGLRYGKIIILADADSDGLHIATLLAALFMQHFPALVKAGHAFVAMPPLFRIDVGKQVFYALDDDEKQRILERIQTENLKGKVSETRFKGLGEMNPSQLRESTINPDTRRLVQLTIEDHNSTHKLMDMLLAKKRATDRRQWLETKGDLAEV